MSGAVKNDAQLLAEWASNQPAGAITPVAGQDIITSETAHITAAIQAAIPPATTSQLYGGTGSPGSMRALSVPVSGSLLVDGSGNLSALIGSDDPANTSGLGAVAILRGVVYGHLAAGVTVGTGQTTATRQATRAGLQAAMNYALSNNKIFHLQANDYEIDDPAGLIYSAPRFAWDGDLGADITQFNSNAPILTIGDPTGNTFSSHCYFSGVSLNYGTSQTGNANAVPVTFGNIAWSELRNILVCPSTVNPGYDAIRIGNGAGVFFSNVVDTLKAWGAQRDLLRVNTWGGSTGCSLDNIYLTNGGDPSYNPISGSYINVLNEIQDWHFKRLNCEWGATNRMWSIPYSDGLKFDAVHIEGVALTGYYPIYFYCGNTSIRISSIDMVDPRILAANLTSPNAILIRDDAASRISIENMTWILNSSGNVDSGLQMFVVDGGPGDTALTIANMRFQDKSNNNQFAKFFLDAHTPIASFPTPYIIKRYDYGPGGSEIRGSWINISGTYTHYGQHVNATLVVPSAITPFTITLAATMGATGNRKPLRGSTVHINRSGGTASGALAVTNAGSPLTNANTATSNGDDYFEFDGANWVAFTPVS